MATVEGTFLAPRCFLFLISSHELEDTWFTHCRNGKQVNKQARFVHVDDGHHVSFLKTESFINMDGRPPLMQYSSGRTSAASFCTRQASAYDSVENESLSQTDT